MAELVELEGELKWLDWMDWMWVGLWLRDSLEIRSEGQITVVGRVIIGLLVCTGREVRGICAVRWLCAMYSFILPLRQRRKS